MRNHSTIFQKTVWHWQFTEEYLRTHNLLRHLFEQRSHTTKEKKASSLQKPPIAVKRILTDKNAKNSKFLINFQSLGKRQTHFPHNIKTYMISLPTLLII